MKKCVDHLGVSYKSVKAMCDHYGLSTCVYRYRMNQGMSVKEVLMTPVKKYGLFDDKSHKYDLGRSHRDLLKHIESIENDQVYIDENGGDLGLCLDDTIDRLYSPGSSLHKVLSKRGIKTVKDFMELDNESIAKLRGVGVKKSNNYKYRQMALRLILKDKEDR